MEQDQEQKHLCKLCNKSFSSGKVLGGHMRCHRTSNLAKSGKKRKKSTMASEIEGQPGYRLRENPKKSWKFSSPNGENPQENVCKICGKGFDSSKALFGHLRHHSGRRKELIHCKECSKGFESLRALTSHMKIHSESGSKLIMDGQSDSENLGFVRRKRSSRTRYKSVPNPSSSDLNECSSFDGIEPEIEELAICLLMLSRGVENWSSSEAKSLHQTQRVLDDGYDSFRLKEQKEKPKFSCNSHSMDGFCKKTETESEEYDSEEVELEFPVGRYYAEVESEMPKLDDESEMTICDKESQSETKNKYNAAEVNQVFIEESGLKSVKSKPSKKQKLESSDSQKEKSSKNSYQEVASHGTVHKRTENCIKVSSENSEKAIEMKTFAETDENCEMGESKGHQCGVCLKVFVSGRALGGHKRAHIVKAIDKAKHATEELIQEQLVGCDENCSMRVEEDGDDGVVGFKPWWDGNGLKHGQLVGLITN